MNDEIKSNKTHENCKHYLDKIDPERPNIFCDLWFYPNAYRDENGIVVCECWEKKEQKQ